MTARDAALVICDRAKDAAEARELLDMCGLLEPGETTGGIALHYSCAGCGQRIRNAKDRDLCLACTRRWVNAGRPDDGPPLPVRPVQARIPRPVKPQDQANVLPVKPHADRHTDLFRPYTRKPEQVP